MTTSQLTPAEMRETAKRLRRRLEVSGGTYGDRSDLRASIDALNRLAGIIDRDDEVGEDEGWHIGGAWGDYGEVVVPLRILSYVIGGERYLLWSGRRGSMTGEGTYRRLSTAKRAAKRLQLKGLDVRITDRLIKESDDMTDREFSEARPCEEGDVMCVDPYPCLVHDRRAAGDDPCSCPSGDGSLRHPCQAHPGDTSDREG